MAGCSRWRLGFGGKKLMAPSHLVRPFRPRAAGPESMDLRAMHLRTLTESPHGLACEILAAAPLLRALARVRTASRGAAAALTTATLQRALAGLADITAAARAADGDLRPWLLGLQRRHFATLRLGPPQPIDSHGSFTIAPRARGTAAAWQVLHDALLRLPDHLREPLFLADGAGCDRMALARILGCGKTDAGERVRAGRAALITALAPAVPEHAPPAALDDRQYFARRLTMALYCALLEGCAEAGERRALEQLLERETTLLAGERAAAASPPRGSRPRRTSWLRLLFITCARPEPDPPSHADPRASAIRAITADHWQKEQNDCRRSARFQ